MDAALGLSLEILTLLIIGALVAGWIDSIAGGGGLITLPLIALAVGTSVTAVGTNKVVAVVSSLTALAVYWRGGHFHWRTSWLFASAVGVGAWIGSSVAPNMPKEWFRWLVIGLCPILLVVVWQRDRWVEWAKRESISHSSRSPLGWVFATGIVVGIYDGFFGPGGGTFMMLGLLLFVRMPLMPAIASTKFVNAVSAGVSLANYAHLKVVIWPIGAVTAGAALVGAYLGARQVSKSSAALVRPVLTVVVLLLLTRLIFSPPA